MKKIFENKKNRIIAIALLVLFLWNFDVPNFVKSLHLQKGDFIKVGKMSVPRYGHDAVLLDDGNVLVFGGYGDGKNTVDIYDSKNKTFTSINPMKGLHGEFSATKLKNGDILIVGWSGGRTSKNAEIFDAKRNVFKFTGGLNYFRSYHSATLLNDGRVLISGGDAAVYNGGNKQIPDEIYDPKTGNFTIAASLNVPRLKFSAILLKDGRVLIAGGGNRSGNLSSAEIYDPKTNNYKLIGNMNIGRVKPNLYILKNGNVLITSASEGKFEIFNPKTNEFKIVAKSDFASMHPAEVLLADDKILFTGGSNGVGLSLTYYKFSEIYDSLTNKFVKGKDMNILRAGHRMTLLKDGNVLITGSEGTGRTAELYIYEDKK